MRDRFVVDPKSGEPAKIALEAIQSQSRLGVVVKPPVAIRTPEIMETIMVCGLN